jgi:hypothetical protein
VVLTIYKSFQFFELQEHVTAVLGLAYLLAALFHLGLEAEPTLRGNLLNQTLEHVVAVLVLGQAN